MIWRIYASTVVKEIKHKIICKSTRYEEKPVVLSSFKKDARIENVKEKEKKKKKERKKEKM